MQGDITLVKFCDSRFRGLRVLIPPAFAILHKLSWSPQQVTTVYRHYTAIPACDRQADKQTDRRMTIAYTALA